MRAWVGPESLDQVLAAQETLEEGLRVWNGLRHRGW